MKCTYVTIKPCVFGGGWDPATGLRVDWDRCRIAATEAAMVERSSSDKAFGICWFISLSCGSDPIVDRFKKINNRARHFDLLSSTLLRQCAWIGLRTRIAVLVYACSPTSKSCKWSVNLV